MYVRINFDLLNDVLNDMNKIHSDFKQTKKKFDAAIEDLKNLIIILIGPQ